MELLIQRKLINQSLIIEYFAIETMAWVVGIAGDYD